MTTYLKELRGHVRGNARLRRKIDCLKARVQRLELTIMVAVDRADKHGVYMEDVARVIGWRRG